MQALRSIFCGSVAALALNACAASGGGGVAGLTTPAVGNDGVVAPRKNLVLTNIGYLHPSAAGDLSTGLGAVDETFNTSFAGLRVNIEPNEALTAISISQSNFGEAGNIVFDNELNTLTFDISTPPNAEGESVSVNETFQYILIDDPQNSWRPNDVVSTSAFGEVPVGRLTILISHNPEAFGFDPSFAGDPDAVLAVLRDPNSGLVLADLESAADQYTAGAFMAYRYGANNDSVMRIRDMTSETPTVYSTIGLVFQDNGGTLDYGAYAFGVQTPVFDMPLAGTASYEGTLGGYLLRSNSVNYFTGGVQIDVDFGTGRADFAMTPAVQETDSEGNAVFQPYESFDGILAIQDNRLTGDIVGVETPSLTGGVQAGFYGINAEEISGTVNFGNANVSGVGAFAAPLDGDSRNGGN